MAHSRIIDHSALWGWLGFAARLIAVAAVVYLMHLGIERLLDWAEANAVSLQMRTMLIVLFVVVYGLAIAIPFVPGVEIALVLFVLLGSAIAPWLYLATVFGLALAFFVGSLTTDDSMISAVRGLGLRRLSAQLEGIVPLSPEHRVAALQGRLPHWMAPAVVQQRYLVLAMLFNLPGNVVLGGGGGIALAAGLSRLFRPAPFIATVALAVLPVPLLVWLMGPGVLAL